MGLEYRAKSQFCFKTVLQYYKELKLVCRECNYLSNTV